MTREEIGKAARLCAMQYTHYEGKTNKEIDLEQGEFTSIFKSGVEFADKHWQEKTKSNLVQLFSDAEFIENLCFSYRHDFGLLDFNKQTLIRFECKEWLRAIINNWKEIE